MFIYCTKKSSNNFVFYTALVRSLTLLLFKFFDTADRISKKKNDSNNKQHALSGSVEFDLYTNNPNFQN